MPAEYIITSLTERLKRSMALDGDSKVFPVTRALATFGRSMGFDGDSELLIRRSKMLGRFVVLRNKKNSLVQCSINDTKNHAGIIAEN